MSRIFTTAMVGFGPIVTKSVPANSIVAGTPAKVVKQGITWDYRGERKIVKNKVKKQSIWNLMTILRLQWRGLAMWA